MKILEDVSKTTWWLMTSIPYGEESRSWLQLRHAVNLHKALCFPVCLFLMYMFDEWGAVPCVYTAAHGTYGITWLLKDALYPDRSWETPCTMASGMLLFSWMCVAYWGAPVLLILGGSSYHPGPLGLIFLVTLLTLGNWLHHTADAQKHFVLKAKKGLITDGLFCRSRNPNYLGEMMLYGAFAGFVWSHPMWWYPWVFLLVTWTCLFFPNWLAKDKSMSRYPEWKEYTGKTGLFLPKLI